FLSSLSLGVSLTTIIQDPGSVTGTEEGEVTVPCSVTGAPPGPVRWYRDTGSGRQYLYSTDPPPPNERNDPRVSRVYPDHPTDSSIRIVRLTVNDSGTYYCEKYRGFVETLIARGSGSRLSVRGLSSGSELVIPVAVAGVVVLIVLLLAVGLYCRFRAGKKKAEIMRTPVLSIETHDKELTYASLDLQKKSNRRSMMIAESEVCAYAEIKGAKVRGAKVRGAKASDDITYASLDVANLKRKTKEPGGGGRGGEPPGKETEYASVNFRKN
ncbi:signal-regulatory protein beta-1-like, partial [Huso huso]